MTTSEHSQRLSEPPSFLVAKTDQHKMLPLEVQQRKACMTQSPDIIRGAGVHTHTTTCRRTAPSFFPYIYLAAGAVGDPSYVTERTDTASTRAIACLRVPVGMVK